MQGVESSVHSGVVSVVIEQEGATHLVCMCFYLHEEAEGYASAVFN